MEVTKTIKSNYIYAVTVLTNPLREAFRNRAIGAVERMAREAAPDVLTAALAAATDTGTLAQVMADQAGSDALRQLEPLAGAIARGADVRLHLARAAGEFLSAASVGKLLGITRAAVDKRRAADRLLALRVRSDWAYPAIQFHDGEVIDGLPDIIAKMAGLSPWSRLDFLLTADEALGGRTPLEAIRSGDIASVSRMLAASEADAFA